MPGLNEWLDQLYREHASRLYKQAWHSLHDQQLAEDLVNETFRILLERQKKQGDLTEHPNIGGWLSQTMKNQIWDELKSARHRLESPLMFDAADSAPDTYKLPLADSLPKGLFPKEREILILLFEEQLSYEEIAQRLGISVLNCRTRAFRARARCKKLMEEEK